MMSARRTIAALLALPLLLAPAAFAAEDDRKQQLKALREGMWKLALAVEKRRPHRASKRFRYENLSDIEVRDIGSVARKVHPGAIVNISEVTVGCLCEDGPGCTDQVSVISYTQISAQRLLLSRINGEWVIGPHVAWWRERDRVWGQLYEPGQQNIDAQTDHAKTLLRIEESYPDCAWQNEDSVTGD